MNTQKILIAGCGSMAKKWAHYAKARSDVSIAGLLDIKKENAEHFASEQGISAPAFTDIDDALAATKADIVFDITIPEAHKGIALTAFRHGAHVFGEKPMASSLADAKKMVAAAERSGKMYAVMQNRRYLKNIRALRSIIDSGTIGDIGFVAADFFIGAHFGGFRDAMASPLILDMAIHTFDQARFIAGADPVSVYCHEFNPKGSWYAGNAAAVATFEFKNGIVFSYRGSWCAEGCSTSWESIWRITGSTGSAVWNGKDLPYAEVVLPEAATKFNRETKRIEAPLVWQGREGHDGCLDEMFSALAAQRKAETDCTDNIKSVAMVFAAIESAKKGKKVRIAW
ncbi:MAG: Gfo/Idh/MocA family oxidoreductase [Spirochaetota bacterium]|mgnify:CR=1 FL=1